MLTPPKIERIDDDDSRPLWSVMIPAFNSQRFIEEALNGVLLQDPGKETMQIMVVDDCSSDNTQEIVRKIGGARVEYYRHNRNIGSLGNFEYCINKSRGHLLHLLHSDDKVLDGFYKKMEALFENFPQIGAGFCRHRYINEFGDLVFLSKPERETAGVLENWLEKLGGEQRIQTPSIVVKRKVYEHLGGFYAVTYGEDWEMWLRIAANYPMGYINDILAEYRKHTSSISGKAVRTGQNLRDLKEVMGITYNYFPKENREKIRSKALNFYANYGIMTANSIWSQYKDKKSVNAQIIESLKMSKSPVILMKIIKLYCKMLLKL